MTTQPERIVDKNGKLTTVHKSVDRTSVSADRLNRLASKDKRVVIPTPHFIPAGTLIEVGKPKDDDDETPIYVNGLRVGGVMKEETNVSIGGGRRNYVVKHNKVYRWFTTRRGAETEITGTRDSFSNGETTRIRAVQLYVGSYFNNIKYAKEDSSE